MKNASMTQTECLVPDYYSEFSCKMGACRTTCCEGWPISHSEQDYWNLLGVECSESLRHKLDCAMRVLDYPLPEEYAQITPDYRGKCPLQMPDGRCGLQVELGENTLASICRLYPRGIRPETSPECSCANSCEAVLELLLRREQPITFQPICETIQQPIVTEETIAHSQEIRLWLISLLQQRGYSLKDRIQMLGSALDQLDHQLRQTASFDITAISLTQEAKRHTPQSVPDYTVYKELFRNFAEGSRSLSVYADLDIADYEKATKALAVLIPNWEFWFENILVNHMFFTQFPFDDPPIHSLC